MRVDKYFFIFFAMVASFIGFLLLFLTIPELITLYVFMIFAYYVLFLVYDNAKWAACVASLFFMLKIINIILIYFIVAGSGTLTLLIVIDVFGFLVSVSDIKKRREGAEEKALTEKYMKLAEALEPISEGKPEIFVEKAEPEEEKEVVAEKAVKKTKKAKKGRKKRKK